MEPTNQGAQNFQNNNGMSIEEAYQHVKNWYAEGKYNEVIDGCEEILRYIPNYEDVPQILAEAKAQQFTTPATPTQQTIPENQQAPSQEQSEAKLEVKKTNQEKYDSGISQDERIVSAIGYIGFLCVLPLLLKKDSEYCKFHGKQALALAIIFFFYKYIGILRDFPIIGGLIQFTLGIVMFIEILVIILAMMQAFRGKEWKIPVVYGMSEKLKF